MIIDNSQNQLEVSLVLDFCGGMLHSERSLMIETAIGAVVDQRQLFVVHIIDWDQLKL